VRAKLSNYLNGKSRWPNDFIVPFTYIFGVSLKEIYGDKGKVKVLYKSEVDKNKIVDLVMDGIRERIKEIIDKNL
jgi:elongation factor P hydroxylase